MRLKHGRLAFDYDDISLECGHFIKGCITMKKNLLPSAVCLLALSVPAMAQNGAPAPGFNLVGTMSASLGGEKTGTIEYKNGSTSSTRLADGLAIGGGIIYLNDQYPVGVKSTLSAKLALGKIASSAKIFKLIPFYQIGNHRIGLGISRHMSPELEVDGALSADKSGKVSGEVAYEDATGLTLEYNWKLFNIQYTSMKYKTKVGNLEQDANHLTIGVNYTFSQF